ncbi:MAG: AAA family ATPase [Pseudomonadota bacterium]
MERGNLSETEQNFARLCKVAELDPSELVRSLNTEHQQRQLMTNRAGAILTEKLRKLWSERPVKVRFNLDAEHFDTLVSDPSDIYDIEVNLEERSRGFKWFFSFYITFAADTDEGMAKNAIVLLDEPGMHLHALAQRDLLDHFIKDFPNPTIYTTHSPFMIPAEDLGSVRTVTLDANGGTEVSNTPAGDANTLFPLRAALSYNLAKNVFSDKPQVLVEDLSTSWYLNAILGWLRKKEPELPDVSFTPAGDAHQISYLATLLNIQAPGTLLLAKPPRKPLESLAQLLWENAIEPINGLVVMDAEPEEMLPEEVFKSLVQRAWVDELNGVDLCLDNSLPGVITQYTQAFASQALTFDREAPARVFIQRMGEAPDALLYGDAMERFEHLFRKIAEKLNA